jgi:predicted anti-sigma-YlaC factor YlaD
MILITCEQVQREVSNYMEDDMTPELRRRVEDHVRTCGGCKAIYDGVRNVIALVGNQGVIELPQGFSIRLYQRLTQA